MTLFFTIDKFKQFETLCIGYTQSRCQTGLKPIAPGYNSTTEKYVSSRPATQAEVHLFVLSYGQ